MNAVSCGKRKIQAVWASVRENAKCVCKHSVEVLSQEDRIVKCGRRLSHQLSTGRRSEHTNRVGTATPMRSSEHREASAHFVELKKGDASRNIVEMIYHQAAVRDLDSRPMPLVRQVLKVENSIAILKRFEKHREVIKKTKTDKKDDIHPRVLVDGNELLKFYGTTMRCCGPRRDNLCNEFGCGVCETIGTGFEMEYNEKKGIIVFSGSSEAFHRGASVSSKKGNVRRAVILCRTIAGVMGYMNEKIEACDSVRSPLGFKLDYLTVRNPRAVLPCFVIVYET